MSLTPTASPDVAVRFGDLPGGDYSPGTVARERLATQLQEFDIEVQSRICEMKAEVSQLVNGLKKTCAVQLIKIPKGIRAMSLRQFQEEYGCNITAVQQEQAAKTITDALDLVPLKPPPSTVRRSKRNQSTIERSTRSMKRSKVDQNLTEVDAPKTTRRSSRRSTTASTKAGSCSPKPLRRSTRSSSIQASQKCGESDENLPRTRRTTRSSAITSNALEQTRSSRVLKDRNSFKTPAMLKKKSKTVNATPAFDPRLPYTPLISGKHEGSILSANVRADRTSLITVPLNGGKCVQLDAGTDFDAIKSALSKKSKKEAVDKLQQLMDQINECMVALK